MKGLLLKDFYMIKKYCRMFLLIAVVFLGIFAVDTNNFFLLLYPVVMVGMIPVNLLAYDEREKWDRYSAVLPYTRAQIVSSKYLIGLAVNAVISIAAITAQMVCAMQNGIFVPKEFLGMCEILFALGMLTPTIVLPFSFKLGTERGRIVYYACVIIVCASGGILGGSGLQMPELPHFTFSSMTFLVIMLVLYSLSWLLSIRFYQEREL